MKNSKAARPIRKRIACLLAVLAGTGVLLALMPASREAEAEDRIKIVTTIFPEYDWVREILGEEGEAAELTCLMGNGVDPHSYQPAVADIMTIASCDLFIYVGGTSDEWIRAALRQTEGGGRKVICLMDELGDLVREEALLEGMQEEEEDEAELDEHVWLSLRNASAICRVITDALCSLCPEKEEALRANSAAYEEELAALDGEYEAAVEEGARRTLLFGDRFPFRYMADDYGLTCYAAFPGCSSETEASFETILFLSAKTDELALPCVLTLENSDQRIAKTIVENTKTKDAGILTLNSMQAVQNAESLSYLGIMRDNLGVLAEALA